MSPTRYSNLFRNRWTAIVWAAGICWTAVELTAGIGIGIGDNDSTMTTNGPSPAEDAATMNDLRALVAELEKQ